MTLAVEQGGAAPAAVGRSVRAWDLPTRLFHWSLVTLIASAYLTRSYSNDPTLYWHRMNGYAILTLLLFRVMWGFAGSSTSRFTHFFPRPIATLHYGLQVLRSRAPHYLGHNPLGSILIFLMLGAVLLQASTGLFTTDDVLAEGPLNKFASSALSGRASSYHARGYWIIGGLVVIHIVANLTYQFIKRDRLINAMVTGRKPPIAYADERECVVAPTSHALACLAVAAAIVGGGVMLAGGSLLR